MQTSTWDVLEPAAYTLTRSAMLELYQAEDCPYSTKVREKLADLGISYVIHNPRYANGDVHN